MDSIKNPQIVTHVNKSLNYTIFDAKFVPKSARFVCLGSNAKGSGVMQIYEITHNDLKGDINLLSDIEKSSSFKCGTFGAADLQSRCIATGDFNGKLGVWDLESPSIPVYSVQGHNEIINSIDGVGGLGIGEGAPEIVTGSRDGSVKVWDPRQKDVPVANIEPNPGEAKRDCWCVAFGHSYNQSERMVAAGYDNGDVKLFDLRTMSLKWETNLKNGAHNSTIWSVKHLPQNRDIFMTTGGTGSLNLWKYSYPSSRTTEDSDGMLIGVIGTVAKLQNVTLSTQPIASFDWCPEKTGLAVCTSFDQALRVLIVTKLNTQ
ncbi:dynein axonemal assembly factor 10 isoform X2 [Hydra vulgaris]|uniref:dynein axonemal assembly factor 10 isoform X2 n=1 Tax=Hydra vulgaris TaxID=6087 RepID=UPI0032EA0DB6